MKSTIRKSIMCLPLAIGGMGLFATSAQGAVTLEHGFLAAAFYQVDSNNVVQANTLIFDLGAASAFRDNGAVGPISVSTVNGALTANIGTQLAAAFGNNWADAGTVRWMLIGNNNSNVEVNGDPNRTIYLSNLNPATTFSSTLSNQVTGRITTFSTNFSNETATANPDVAQMPITAAQSVNEFVPPDATVNAGLWFAQGQDVTQALSDSSGVAGSLDVYRVVRDGSTGGVLTSGYGGTATRGLPQYIGTFQLSSTGNLSVVPEPSAALLGLVGTLGLVLRRRRDA